MQSVFSRAARHGWRQQHAAARVSLLAPIHERRRSKTDMANQIPTQIGDVLILYKDGNPLYAVGLVSEDGQQTVNANVIYESGRMAAIGMARSLVIRGRRIYMKNTDTVWWVPLK
jgi:hypothetical protein